MTAASKPLMQAPRHLDRVMEGKLSWYNFMGFMAQHGPTSSGTCTACSAPFSQFSRYCPGSLQFHRLRESRLGASPAVSPMLTSSIGLSCSGEGGGKGWVGAGGGGAEKDAGNELHKSPKLALRVCLRVWDPTRFLGQSATKL